MMPRLYAIVDAGVLAGRGVRLEEFAQGLRAAGVGLVQYRDKDGSPREVLRAAEVLRTVMRSDLPRQTQKPSDMGHPILDIGDPFDMGRPILIMNDRADLAVLAGFDGVHVGQGDLSPEDAKRVMSGKAIHPFSEDEKGWATRVVQLRDEWGTQLARGGIVGVSTHTGSQVRAADASCADHIAIGPVFATGAKADTEPVVGLEGVRRARALTTKPLVAIGGITRANARSVIDAGADSVAVISGLLAEGESVEQVARDFLELLG